MHKLLLSVTAVLLATQILTAQHLTNEELFQKARQEAFSKEYEAAIGLLTSLQAAEPENTDYRIFLARVYSWKEDYKMAVETLDKLLLKEPFPQEALEVMVTVQLWSNNYSEALRYSNLGIEVFGDPVFLMQKAKALKALDKPEAAKKVLLDVLASHKNNGTAQALYVEILQSYDDVIAVSYTNTTFSSPAMSPWHSAWLSYKKDLGETPVLVKYHFGSIYDREGSQLEAEAYPKVGRAGYLHLNAGIGLNNEVFPNFRTGIEYYQSLKRFEISAGSRLLSFDSRDVYLITGQVSYSAPGNLNLSYRPYAARSDKKWNLTHTFSLELSNPLKESIWRLDLQYGSVPYEYITESSFSNLETFRIGLQHRLRVSENILVRPVVMYEYEEFLPSEYRNRFNLQLISTFRF